MRSLLAHIADPVETADRRRTNRRTLRLDVAARTATSESAVIIRNLSRTGLLIETGAGFSIGETFLLVLPELGAAPARVVRHDGRLFGCEFLAPVPASAISAALLKAHPDEEPDDMAAAAATGDAGELYTRRPSSAILFTALTALFTAVVLLFVFTLVSLTVSAG
ncbi:MAG: PilZ domain-containing protein [Sphingopyxis sp.]|nr:PilZ domain-containing protein [Sphingopyxis sp.]MDZ4368499.1 PilZ domain-containing protein [Afipia sp.]